MNILVILAHDKKQSLVRFLCEKCSNYAQAKGHSITILDLYKHVNEIPFFIQPEESQSITNKKLDDFPFVQTIKDQFLSADMVMLFFPIYCFSVPAILKAWFDLLTTCAYEKNEGRFPKPLHHIKKTFTVTTMGMPWIYKVFGVHNCVKHQIKSIFSWIRIKENKLHELTSVEKINPTNIDKTLKKLYQSLDNMC